MEKKMWVLAGSGPMCSAADAGGRGGGRGP